MLETHAELTAVRAMLMTATPPGECEAEPRVQSARSITIRSSRGDRQTDAVQRELLAVAGQACPTPLCALRALWGFCGLCGARPGRAPPAGRALAGAGAVRRTEEERAASGDALDRSRAVVDLRDGLRVRQRRQHVVIVRVISDEMACQRDLPRDGARGDRAIVGSVEIQTDPEERAAHVVVPEDREDLRG